MHICMTAAEEIKHICMTAAEKTKQREDSIKKKVILTWAYVCVSVYDSPTSSTVPPNLSTACTLISGATIGMQIIALHPFKYSHLRKSVCTSGSLQLKLTALSKVGCKQNPLIMPCSGLPATEC